MEIYFTGVLLDWVYALVGLVPILVTLLRTGHALLHPIGETEDGGCPDARVWKLLLHFGGAAGLTFGWHYRLAAGLVSEPWLKAALLTYADLHFAGSLVQFLAYLLQAAVLKRQGKLTKKVSQLKAHWGDKYGRRGCGFTTGMSPFWWLYWLALSTKPKTLWGNIIGIPRDIITLIDYLASLPAAIVLSLITRFTVGVWIRPTLRGVDRGD